jgi:hypothetical protein
MPRFECCTLWNAGHCGIKPLLQLAATLAHPIPSSSTSKMSVELGGIAPG